MINKSRPLITLGNQWSRSGTVLAVTCRKEGKAKKKDEVKKEIAQAQKQAERLARGLLLRYFRVRYQQRRRIISFVTALVISLTAGEKYKITVNHTLMPMPTSSAPSPPATTGNSNSTFESYRCINVGPSAPPSCSFGMPITNTSHVTYLPHYPVLQQTHPISSL